MINSMYQILWLFYIYAFLGWCCEIAFCGIKEGHFVNRGFLNGPWCPIYGCGGVLIIMSLTAVSKNIFLLFIGSFVICSAIEFLTGFVLEKIYKARWWDYSDRRFNIKGYICAEFSVIWGFFGILLMKLIHPAIYGLVTHMSNAVGYICICIVTLIFVSDLAITALTIRNMQSMIKNADEIAQKIRNLTEIIARRVYSGAVRVDNIKNDISENEDVRGFVENAQAKGRVLKHKTNWQIAEFRAEHENEIEELNERIDAVKDGYERFKNERDEDVRDLIEKLNALKTRYNDTARIKNILQQRIIQAFPRLDFKGQHDTFEKIKKEYRNRKNKTK